MIYARQAIRLACDVSAPEQAKDIVTSATPRAPRATDIEFQLSLWKASTLLSVANLASLTLSVHPASDRDGAPLMLATLSAAALDDSLSEETWNNGTKQHALIPFTNAETALTLSGNETDFWLRIEAMTTASPSARIILAGCTFTLWDAGITTTPTPPLGDANYLTAAQIAAGYVAINAPYLMVKGTDGNAWPALVEIGDNGLPTGKLIWYDRASI